MDLMGLYGENMGKCFINVDYTGIELDLRGL
jgi:hypothetical protein